MNLPQLSMTPWMVLGAVLVTGLASCASSRVGPTPREAKARYQYNHVMRTYQVPSIDATNAATRQALLDQAAFAYQQVANEFTDVPRWAAAALRSLGQIHVARGEFKEGLSCFEQVGQRYPGEHWEVIQSWKAAADSLWEQKHRGEALLYYRQIVDTYGQPGQPEMFDIIVDIARSRLHEQGVP